MQPSDLQDIYLTGYVKLFVTTLTLVGRLKQSLTCSSKEHVHVAIAQPLINQIN